MARVGNRPDGVRSDRSATTTLATLLGRLYVRRRHARALCSPLPPGIGDHPYRNEHEHTENYRHQFGLLNVTRVGEGTGGFSSVQATVTIGRRCRAYGDDGPLCPKWLGERDRRHGPIKWLCPQESLPRAPFLTPGALFGQRTCDVAWHSPDSASLRLGTHVARIQRATRSPDLRPAAPTTEQRGEREGG
jgi:hypothetical protein